MKIVALSDTHSYHRKVIVPAGDMLIHAGDISFRGELNIIADFSNWLQTLPHKHKIVIFGNHELGMRYGSNRSIALQIIRDAGTTYLEDSGIEIEGLRIYGSPWQPAYFDWEWNLPRHSQTLRDVWNRIPDDTNILITHGPPYGILDKVRDVTRHPQGCEILKKRVLQLPNLKAHIFGHMHMQGGQMLEVSGTKFVNSAICDDDYNPSRSPVVIDI